MPQNRPAGNMPATWGRAFHRCVGTASSAITVPVDWTGWLEVGRADKASASLRFYVSAGSSVRLSGLRVGEETSLNWPWDTGVTLSYRDNNDKMTLQTFSSRELVPTVQVPLQVISDYGSTVLARVLPKGAKQ